MAKTETFTVYLEDEDKFRKVKGVRVQHWAMRPEGREFFRHEYRKLDKDVKYIFWHISSGLECCNGAWPRDVILEFLNSKKAYRLGSEIQAAQATGCRALAEAKFYSKAMPAWIKFVGDRNGKELEALRASLDSIRPEANALHNMLQDKSMPLTALHARNLLRAIEDDHEEVIEALKRFIDSKEKIDKASDEYNKRWGR